MGLPETATDDLDLRLDRLRRTMLERSAASGRLRPSTLARLTSVLPTRPQQPERRADATAPLPQAWRP